MDYDLEVWLSKHREHDVEEVKCVGGKAFRCKTCNYNVFFADEEKDAL